MTEEGSGRRASRAGRRRRRRRHGRPDRLPDRLRASGEEDVHPHPGRQAAAAEGGLPRLRPVRARALRRLRLGERPGGAPGLRPGARDLAEGAADEQRRGRLGEADAGARRQRLVHGRRLPRRPRRGGRLLLGRPEPRLRRQRYLEGRAPLRLEELPGIAGPRERADPPRLRAAVRAVGRRRGPGLREASASRSTRARTSTGSRASTPSTARTR